MKMPFNYTHIVTVKERCRSNPGIGGIYAVSYTHLDVYKRQGLILACIAATGLTGCGKTDETSKKHEAITFMAPYLEVDSFIEEVHKTYPEVNLEVITYSGSNTTTYLQNMLEADDLPDICTQTFYKPDVVDVSDKMIDLSGYDFTDNYVESRLKEVSDDGALYMLPSLYNLSLIHIFSENHRKISG